MHGGCQRAPGWETLGGLPDQAHYSSHAVSACTERRRLPTPAGQPRGDDALLLCGRAHELRPLHDLVSEVENLPTAVNNDIMKGAHA